MLQETVLQFQLSFVGFRSASFDWTEQSWLRQGSWVGYWLGVASNQVALSTVIGIVKRFHRGAVVKILAIER